MAALSHKQAYILAAIWVASVLLALGYRLGFEFVAIFSGGAIPRQEARPVFVEKRLLSPPRIY
jgi:hypothetical protein